MKSSSEMCFLCLTRTWFRANFVSSFRRWLYLLVKGISVALHWWLLYVQNAPSKKPLPKHTETLNRSSLNVTQFLQWRHLLFRTFVCYTMTQHSRNQVTWLNFYSGATLFIRTFVCYTVTQHSRNRVTGLSRYEGFYCNDVSNEVEAHNPTDSPSAEPGPPSLNGATSSAGQTVARSADQSLCEWWGRPSPCPGANAAPETPASESPDRQSIRPCGTSRPLGRFPYSAPHFPEYA